MDSRALYTLTYGMYIVTSASGGRVNGQVANTVFQVSSTPPTLAVSINKDNLTHHHIKDCGSFCVSVLDQEAPLRLIGQFGFRSGRDLDKFEGVEHETTGAGLPYLTRHILAYLEAQVIGEADCGTHTVFLGQLTDSAILADGTPMTYAHYRQVKGGTAPATAPVGVGGEMVMRTQKEDDNT